MSRYVKNFALESGKMLSGSSITFNNSTDTFGVSVSAPSTLTQNNNFKLPRNSGSQNSVLSQLAGGDSKWVNGLIQNYIVSANQTYSTGTASQTNNTLTGVGTTFTSAMVGGVVEYATGATALITAFTSTTALTVQPSQTVANNTYSIYYGGSQIHREGMSKKRMLMSGSSSGVLTMQANAATTNYTATWPNAVATIANQALTSDTSGNLSWTNVAVNGGNSLGAAMSLGTNDAYGLNLKTNAATVFGIDASGNITGTGSTWTQNGVQLQFVVAGNTITNYQTASVTSFTVPFGRDSMQAQLWGAGGGYRGGSGAYVKVSWNVTSGDTYWLLVGAPGSGASSGPGGNAGGVNASGGGGTGGGNCGGGGQYTALFRQSGSNYILIACAGGGGGGTSLSYTAGGGGANASVGSTAGSGGIAGTSSNFAGTAQNYNANATTTGLTSLGSAGGFGANGINTNNGSGGGGYGGGGASAGVGSGGGNYAPTVGGNVISSSVTNGNNGSIGTTAPPTDTNYINGYGVGGGQSQNGGTGLAVITFFASETGMSTSTALSTNINLNAGGKLKLWRPDNTQHIKIGAPVTSNTYVMTLPSAVPVRANQALVGDIAATCSFADVALHNGNTLGAALSLGTTDAFPINFKTNNATVLTIDALGNLTGTGSNWSQNGISMAYIAPNNTTTSYSTPAVVSFSTPVGRDRMRVQLWGAGGGELGGSGAYVDVTWNVAVNAIYWLLVGAGGGAQTYTGTSGGNAGGANASGGGGAGGGQAGGGGQYTALFAQIGSNFYLLACAGGGGGAQNGTQIAGGGGVSATGSGANSFAGVNGTGGNGESAGLNGQNYSANALTTGETSLGAFGGYGGSGSFNCGGGGGGYGGGGSGTGAGSGGGNYAPAVGGTVVSSSVTNGNYGNISGSNPPNSSDPNYVSGYGRGGAQAQAGGSGLAVVTFYTTTSYVGQPVDKWMLSGSSTKYFRSDNAFGTLVKASPDIASDWSLTLPADVPSTMGQALTSTTGGITSWSNVLGPSGNAYTQDFLIGPSDNYNINWQTNGIQRLSLSNSGDLTLKGDTSLARSFKFNQADNLASVSVKAPTTNVTNYTLTLPPAVATANKQSLVSSTSGGLSWEYPPVIYPSTNVTSSTTLTTAYNVITTDATTGNIILTLPASAASTGMIYHVLKSDSSANTVTLKPQSGELFNKVVDATFVATSQDDTITVVSFGARGWIVQ